MKLEHGNAEEAGVRPETVELIRRRAEEWVAEYRTQSLCLVLARRDVIFLHEAWGPLTHEPESPPLLKNSLFPLASLTKPITVTAAIILVEDGLLGPNRPVQEYIPEFVGEGKEKVMVHHLMTHTSGINDEPIIELVENEPDDVPIPTPDANQDEFINKALTYTYMTPLAFEPGEKMAYANLGIYMVGELVRRVSGQSLDQFARERIFGPLGMHDSYYIVPEAEQPRVVRRPDEVHFAESSMREWMERPSPSGGIYSTAIDVAHFGQMYLKGGVYGNKRILSRASVKSMTCNHIPGLSADLGDLRFPEASWGLGWSVGHVYKGRVYGEELLAPTYFNHGGYGGVELWIHPETQVVGVYFSVSTEADEADFTIYNADLVMNMVATGIEKGERPAIVTVPAYPAPAELRHGTPEQAGMDPDRVKAIVDRAKGWVDDGIQPSLALYVARRGVIFLDEVFGRSSPEPDSAPLTREALFPLASITKPITATAVMILVEEGLVGLNQPVQEYVPEFLGEKKHLVLIRHLLTHTSGLQDEAQFKLAVEQGFDIDPSDPYSAWPEIARDYDKFLNLLYDTPLGEPPNQTMAYADANFELLGQVIRRASGMRTPEFIRSRIFEPLGMTNSFFPLPEPERPRLVQRSLDAPGHAIREMLIATGMPSTSSGAYSTTADLAIFGVAMLNRGAYGSVRILSPTSVDAMTRVQTPGIPAVFGEESFRESEWGLGWGVHQTNATWAWDEPLLSKGTFCHGGLGGVFMWVDPTHELVAVLCSVYERFKENGLPDANHDLYINSLLAAINRP
ncbi:MAG: serine hydrolase domain-containing protein [Anaerolineales bacterium]